MGCPPSPNNSSFPLPPELTPGLEMFWDVGIVFHLRPPFPLSDLLFDLFLVSICPNLRGSFL